MGFFDLIEYFPKNNVFTLKVNLIIVLHEKLKYNIFVNE